MLAPAVLCYKEPARASKAPNTIDKGYFACSYEDSWLPCSETGKVLGIVGANENVNAGHLSVSAGHQVGGDMRGG